METVQEALVHNPLDEAVKTNATVESAENQPDVDVCQKSNGVADISDTVESNLENDVICTPTPQTESTNATASSEDAVGSEAIVTPATGPEESSVVHLEANQNSSNNDDQPSDSIEHNAICDNDVSSSSKFDNLPIIGLPENITTVKELMEDIQKKQRVNNDNVKFETEILVETNDNDVNELDLNSTNNEENSQESASNILTELGQNIELSEALRSSDNAENGENNNHAVDQEVFNKEELLDILEGNDMQSPDAVVGYEIEINLNAPDGKSEAQLALEQLSRLKKTRTRKSRSSDVISRRRVTKSDDNVSKAESNRYASEIKKDSTIKSKKEDNVVKFKKEESVLKSKKDDSVVKSKKEDGALKSKKDENTEKPKKEVKSDDSIVNKLVEDWDDDETESEQTDHLAQRCNSLLTSTEQLVEAQKTTVNQDATARTSIDSATSDGPMPNKGNEDGQPQRRLGRVIKKKVIFDPDNPDTFTKTKISIKKESQVEEPPLKKGKIEPAVPRPKSKSPVSKLQWKKPQPKNSKQNKRLSEVDKLLMDEGAVNMIYQLTPEAPKGKKNMRTKAEFIKKIQSSTPETKEMKFRERKIKAEEGEAKKILGGKQRSSLSSSVKSPSVCEDFETHSADDSIIYRRHSSSSYSSTCMSPRRLSDVEAGGNQSTINKSAAKEVAMETDNAGTDVSANTSSDLFATDAANVTSDIINKDDCLSIKEKLNSKLSLALNKRKGESSKTDKPVKQKKLAKVKAKYEKYTFISVKHDQSIAEICIRKTGRKTNIQTFKELCQALEEVDAMKEVSVTLLTSECGTLCSELDLSSLVIEDMDQRKNSAYEFAEAIRLVMFAMIQHSKLLCTCVWGSCSGVALALVALSDVALASESATFALAGGVNDAVTPGIMLLSSPWQSLPQSLVTELVVFGRRLSAWEAARGGLLSRVLGAPARAPQHARQLVRDFADQPAVNILLKKRLLSLKNVSSNTFLVCLIKERDLMINYWTSVEGQALLYATSTGSVQ